MDSKIFKKIVKDFLVLKNFQKKGSYFCLFFDEIIIVVGIQRSNYSNGYYINIGYIISDLNSTVVTFRDTDGDVRTRFSVNSDGISKDFFDLDTLQEETKLLKHLEENFKEYIENVTTLKSLVSLLNRYPVMLYQTKLSAKEKMGFI